LFHLFHKRNCIDSNCTWCITGNTCFNQTEKNNQTQYCPNNTTNIYDCTELKCFLQKIFLLNPYICMKNEKSASVVAFISIFIVFLMFFHVKKMIQIKPWQRFETEPENPCLYCSNPTNKEKKYDNQFYLTNHCKNCSTVLTGESLYNIGFFAIYFSFLFLMVPIGNTFFDNPIP
jgi:hypothetical protein